MTYPKDGSAEPQGSPSFPALEQRVLDHWTADGTFAASVGRRAGGPEFVFYDGPPFANGLPHYGHLLTGYVKDVVPRYRTMRGDLAERRFGWDCHGLPAEVEAEKELGIGHKSEIERMGVAAFNDACRTSVLRYTREWRRYVDRQGRWVDFEHDYKTLDLGYMESVLWAFRTLWDKGLVYEGFRVLAYCWRCETPLSNTETRMDDVYRDRQDPALTVRFRLETGEWALAWTTTPWTLPSTVALAVAPDVDYLVVEQDGERYLIAGERLAAYDAQLGEAAGGRVAGTVRGSDLVGRRFTPVLPYMAAQEQVAAEPNAFTVLAGDFVTTEEGTGIVQMAPAFGEDDHDLCAAAGIPILVALDEQGRFNALVPDYRGQQVFEANPAIIRDLKANGSVLRHDSYRHSYPHCWRCDNPLIYKAVSSWFVAVTKFRDRMVELNQDITWVPGHVKDGSFGKWLANARDWSISRNRFWGTPIPVWTSDDPAYPRTDVYGSLDQLERDFGVRPDDLHRPGIDELTRPNPDDPTGRSTMRRVPEVLDCWFESGSMPYAQVHYPFENTDWFEHHYPGDFIVEYSGQTRGWFYTLHVLATALFDRPAFRLALVHGILLGDDGQKMSKSRRNYPDVGQVFDHDGSDAMRWFLMSSPILRGGELIVTKQGVRDSVRQILLPLWNAWQFFVLYANLERHDAAFRTRAEHVLDRYVLARTGDLVDTVTAAMDRYDLAAACEAVRRFVDALNNWYVRRSRRRFWDGEPAALDTLYTALLTVSRCLAPLLPFVTETLYRGLTGERSVHLTDWPDRGELPADDALVAAMERAREVCSAASALRKVDGLRVRQPLARLTVAAPDSGVLAPLTDLVAAEVNVRAVELTGEDGTGLAMTRSLKVDPRKLGPRLGKRVQEVIGAARTGDWSIGADGTVIAAGVTLAEGEYELVLSFAEAGSEAGEGTADVAAAVLPGGGFVVLDTSITPELEAEGVARDVVRAVQQARRDAGLAVADRIRLGVDGDEQALEAVATHRALITTETLATELTFGAVPAVRTVRATVGQDLHLDLTLERVHSH